MKDRLYLEDRQRMQTQAQQPQQQPDLTPEDTGLDPQTHKAVMLVADRIATRKIAGERAVFEQQIGMLANRSEKAELLATKGADKAKYLPDIQRKQQEHYQRTGTFLPAEIALEILMSDEKDAKIRALEARLAAQPGQPGAPAPAAAPAPAPAGVPSAAATRHIPGGAPVAPPAAGSAGKTFADLSVEEMEARLEEQFKSGQRA